LVVDADGVPVLATEISVAQEIVRAINRVEALEDLVRQYDDARTPPGDGESMDAFVGHQAHDEPPIGGWGSRDER
jgi:hypothetical protein